MSNSETRTLSEEEYKLAYWMLEHGTDEALSFIPQLKKAEAKMWKCPCGCASYNFRIKGMPDPDPGVHILGDFYFQHERNESGIFIYSCDGILSGVEIYGLSGDASKHLPSIESLCTYDRGRIDA